MAMLSAIDTPFCHHIPEEVRLFFVREKHATVASLEVCELLALDISHKQKVCNRLVCDIGTGDHSIEIITAVT
jgi:hypothetical protein